MKSEVFLEVFSIENGAQHSPLSFVLGSPKGRISRSTQIYDNKYLRHQMNTEYKSNVRMAPEIKILSIWRARKMNPLIQNVNFRCSISGDFGLHMQLFLKMTKVEKSFENEV